jgi:GntR family transcriptional regulator
MTARLGFIRQGDGPLHRQLSDQLVYRIATGSLARGARLPSLRVAQRECGVHLHTVRRAYLTLQEMGLVTIRRGGAVVLPAITPGEPRSLTEAVSQFLLHATARFGTDAASVLREVERQGKVASTITVAECSNTLASSLAEQLVEVWHVQPTIQLVRDVGRATGPVITTYFHLAELSRQVPDEPTMAVRIRVSPGVVRQVARLVQRGPLRSVAICETDPGFSQRLAGEVAAAVGQRVPVTMHTPIDIEQRVDRREPGALKLVSPCQWDHLSATSRGRPDVMLLGYTVDPRDLEMLGTQLGWQRTLSQEAA